MTARTKAMRNASLSVFAASIACACILPASHAVQGQQGGNGDIVSTPVSNSVPPMECYRQAYRLEYSVTDANDQDQEIYVKARFYDKSMTLEYSVYEDIGGSTFRVVREEVNHPASMYITGVIHLGGGKLAVSGMDQTTKLARIEVWNFSRPAVYRVPTTGGGTEYIFRPSNLDAVSIGFAPSADSGFGLVRSMWPNRGLGEGHLLVLNCQNRDLFSIDLASKTATRFMSSTDMVGSNPPVPELTNNWAGSYGPRRHFSLGDAYVLSMEGEVAPPDEVPVRLYLWDNDADGTIDAVNFLSNGQSAAMGFADPAVWDVSWPE